MARGRGRRSARWHREHADDAHVKRAAAEGYRTRAVYKLRELDARDGLLRPGATVLELGAAPGGWTQYAVERVGPGGRVVASDILPMAAVPGATFVQGDFAEAALAERLERAIGEAGADLVLSDMAPNLSGVAASDQARSVALAELVLETARAVLNPDGALVVKVFQGEGFDVYLRSVRDAFHTVRVRKPDASRPRSREVYLVAAKLVT